MDQPWILVSDGSYSEDTAAYSWILHDGQAILHSSIGMAPGNPASVFCAELFGIVTWYCCLTHLLEYFDITTTVQLTYYTDNSKVIMYHQHMHNNDDTKFPFFDDFDLYSYMCDYHTRLANRGVAIHPIKKNSFSFQ